MTREEFNDYLVSIGGLVRTWNTSKGPILDASFFQIKEGWYSLVRDLIDELITAGWNKKIYEVKEKVGGLRFYAIEVPEGRYSIIARYEAKSYEVCERCGEAGRHRSEGWMATLCDKHAVIPIVD